MHGMGIRRDAEGRRWFAGFTVCLAASVAAPAWAQGGYPDEPSDASQLRGAYGFQVPGLPGDQRLGRTVAAAGDLNLDGVDDFVITSFEGSSAGVYVVFGRPDGGFADELDLSTLDGTNGFAITGFRSGSTPRFARVAGDLNHDGVDDLFIGGTWGWPNIAILFYGRPDGVYPAEVQILDLEPGDAAVLQVDAGRREPRISTWTNGAGVGDFNGDGIDDLVVSNARLGDFPDFESRAFVLFGSADGLPFVVDLESLNGDGGFVILPEAFDDFLGISVDGAGDLNGDGLADIVVGAPGQQGPLSSIPFDAAGKAHVVFGNATPPAVFSIADLDGTNGFTLRPERDEAFGLGYGVAGLGDVNGDGLSDVAFGAPDGGAELQGEAYVLYGRETFDAEYRTDLLTVEDGLLITGRLGCESCEFQTASLGWSLSAGDPNGDGVPDLILGDPTVTSGIPQTPAAHVVFGRSVGGPLDPDGVLALDDLDGRNGFTILRQVDFRAFFGGSVGGLGDINADGIGDIGIGANLADARRGRAFVHFGGGLCRIDLNFDRQADLFDVLEFSNLFQSGDPLADWDEDGVRTPMDLQAFLDDFGAGCP